MRTSVVRYLRFPSVIRAALALCLAVALSAGAALAQGSAYNGPAKDNIKLGKSSLQFFGVIIKEKHDADDMLAPYSFVATYKNKTILSVDRSNSSAVEHNRIIDDFPEKGMTTLEIHTFSGGAHCCAIDYWITKSGDKIMVSTIDYMHNAEEGDPTEYAARKFGMTDWGMSYYEAKQGKNSFGFSFAESPNFARIALYDAGRWRADKPGEFPDKYRGLIDRVKKSKSNPGEMAKAARAMVLAYYGLMAGDQEKAVFEAMKKSLPRSAVPFAQTIFTDLKKSMTNFEPIKTSVYQ